MEPKVEVPSKDSTRARLQEFCYYFIQSFEEQLHYFRSILEESPNSVNKSTSLPITITSGLAGAIPTFGKHIGTGLQQGEKYIVKRIDKKNACTLAKIVYAYGVVKDELRDILIRGVFEVFYSFQIQFMQVTCNGGPTRAMQKLATDASHRFITFLLDNYQEDITSETVTIGILSGDSKRHKLGVVKSGRTLLLENTDDTITTSSLYTKVGICLKNEEAIKFYKNKKTMTNIIGHRLLFEWENPADIENEWEIDEVKSTYEGLLSMSEREEEVQNMRQYIIRKDPLEDIKECNRENFEEQTNLQADASQERKQYQKDLLEDNEVKHDNIVTVIEEKHDKLLETLNISQQKILEHTVKKFTEINDNVNERHEQISENVDSIRHELCETKSTISTTEETLARRNEDLEKDVMKLKEHHAETENKMVLQVNKNEVRKIQEQLKALDPVRAIAQCGEFKKLKKRFKF